jgi:hypothetical protein
VASAAPAALSAWPAEAEAGHDQPRDLHTQEQHEDEDDVTVQKRRAQAAQAAASAAAAASVGAALGRLRDALTAAGAGGSLAGAALALGELAQELLEPPHALAVLLRAGGLPHVAAAISAAAAAAALGSGAGADEGAALPALLQASWVLLHTAHGGPDGRAAIAAPAGAAALATLLATGLSQPADGAGKDEADDSFGRPAPGSSSASGNDGARAASLRNASLAALLLVDQPGPGAAAAGAAGEALRAAGALELLGRTAGFDGCGGPAAAALAAGALAALAAGSGTAADAAADALLRPEALRGAVFLLGAAAQPPLASASAWATGLHALPCAPRALELLAAALPRLLASRPDALLRALIEERLVGPLLAAAPRRMGQLLVAHLVSSRGQAALAVAEAEWAVDAPLALAQAIAAPAHLTLPAAAMGAASAGAPRSAGGAATALLGAGSGGLEDVHTDVLAARLLLQGPRLLELVHAFGDEAEEAAACTSGVALLGDATAALLALARHLLGRESELAAVRLLRGDSVADSSSEGSAGCYSGSASGSGSAASCGAHAAAAGFDDATPWLGATAAARRSGAGPVAFAFGCHEHRLGLGAYRRLRRASKLLHSVLLRAGAQAGEPVTTLRVPALSDAANWWALTRLHQWVDAEAPTAVAAADGDTGAGVAAGKAAAGAVLEPLDARQVALLWVAADFWQVDGLQAACEDRLVAAIEAAPLAGATAADGCTGNGGDEHAAAAPTPLPQLLSMALALCGRHAASSSRLRRLLARAFLRASSAPGAAAEVFLPAAAAHRDVLLPAVWEDLRDRLTALCVLNAGRDDADAPESPVSA